MIVAISGGKGGVGKSTVAMNLARELEAIVVDADLTAPDLPRGRAVDLHDVLAGRADPMDAVVHHGSLCILPCGRTLAGARASDLAEMGRTVRRVERDYGDVVVDCPAGLARDVGTALHCADVAVLVTTPNRPALLDAVRTRRLALDLETPIAAVVLNRSRNGRGAQIDGRVEATFEAPATVVPERAAIADATRAGKPVRDVRPTDRVLEVFERIARQLERCHRRRADDGSLSRS
ncbi:chromosome partitioning protein ParA [Natrarchaeobius halalkaliphilus]|uniref:Chromosome partitioning protein ParA n=1 Tax=Natrarchaeobius halalkaliphilus TaxID=1679091 RepID=A0A3N6M6R2_9EURY|nr:P-loop NTPase [Natrarchaeobius halalkaliphilus]RQG89016.1 chromosome partitioning protein ParA [Natrarchaeobius halalkaliphilus]